MRNTLLPLLLPFVAFTCGEAVCQWTVTSPLSGNRMDDIFFIGPDTGWVAGGSDGNILRTYDGGASWDTVYTGMAYLRSIEFTTPEIGFCGSLDSVFLKTTDGGDSWQDISNSFPPPISICGLCAPTPEVIFGVGVYSEPAYVVRSLDGGDSWTKTDLSSMASGMVDVFFLNADTGFIAGIAPLPNNDGILLATVDGGETWTERHRTGTNNDVVWKLQSPDGDHIYGSVDAFGGTPTRYIRSADRGATWVTDTISLDYTYIQMIGFVDTLHGWMGAGDLLETVDGGENWSQVDFYGGYDRFHRVNDSLAYMCGLAVYKYGDTNTGVVMRDTERPRELVEVLPNPTKATASLRIDLVARSRTQIDIADAQGRWIRSVFNGTSDGGERTFPLDVEDLAPGTYHVMLRTNQGLSHTSFVKQ